MELKGLFEEKMMYSTLCKIGSALMPAVGPLHDALGGKDAPQSQAIQANPESKAVVDFYVGGTAVVAAAVTALLCAGKKKPVRRRKTTTRRRTYRRRR